MIKKAITFIFVIVMLVACQSEKTNDSNKAQKQHEGEKVVIEQEEIQPLTIEQSAFHGIGDWYDDHHVLVIKEDKQGFVIDKYNIYTGEAEPFFYSDDKIISVKANDDDKMFLVHIASSEQEATLLVLNRDGEIEDTFTMESFDVQYTWNPFSTDEVFITSFLEDWTFHLFLRNTTTKAHQLYDLPQPFIHWIGEDEIAYLDLDDTLENPYAPLVVLNLNTDEERVVKDQVVGLSSSKSLIVTIEENNGVGTYTFFNSEFKKLDKMKLPIITEHEGLMIPYSQIDQASQSFYTFSAGVDNQFDLIGYSLKDRKAQVIVEDMENMPLNLSINGKLSLVGYQFEQIIDIEEGDVIDLVNFK
ncbi:hypothetical protein [Bacillus sp. CGMCC 1.16541]|uniref:YqgU-like beta propeller domain-containing protein n=1 Tax=Bacillus sp. CGMCC 1.16541 TaxID=2185143 RepID=UPI000D73F45A|nr:hypothetical protein [Bacillus sp. CGMCC 1.16541]